MSAWAQEQPEDAGHEPPGGWLPAEWPRSGRLELPPRVDNGLPAVQLTGYWPPTNEMLRAFSPSPTQNPGGWVGADWEGRGYNVYAFFPEFPGGTTSNPKGNGDFEVDYQDTSGDWWALVAGLRPIALITFSRANTANGWELEGGNRTYALTAWSNDYLDPRKPTPELPIAGEPALTERYSSLPIAAILAAVAASGANVDPFTTVIDDGRFLSNFVGYHGNWYHLLHAAPEDAAWNIAAGHIHVGGQTVLADAVLATEVTVRTLLEHVDAERPPGGDVNGDDVIDSADVEALAACVGGPDAVLPDDCLRADNNRDGDADLADYAGLQRRLATGR